MVLWLVLFVPHFVPLCADTLNGVTMGLCQLVELWYHARIGAREIERNGRMARRYGSFYYWCVEFTDLVTGLVTEAGNETSFAALAVWVQKNLDQLPKGEGKFVKKRLRNV